MTKKNVANNKANNVISISDMESNNDSNCGAASNNHSNDATTNNPPHIHPTRLDFIMPTVSIVSFETMKPFSDGKITTTNCPRIDEDQQRKQTFKTKVKAISNISDNEINNRKNTNLHFIGWL